MIVTIRLPSCSQLLRDWKTASVFFYIPMHVLHIFFIIGLQWSTLQKILLHSTQILVINKKLGLTLRCCRKITIFSSFFKILLSYLKQLLTKNCRRFLLASHFIIGRMNLWWRSPLWAIYLCRVNLETLAPLFNLLYMRQLPFSPRSPTEAVHKYSVIHCKDMLFVLLRPWPSVTQLRSLFLNKLLKAKVKLVQLTEVTSLRWIEREHCDKVPSEIGSC